MLHGRVLYRDVVDHKPPLIYLTYAATQALGGRDHGMLLLHLLTILVVWATALLLGRIAARAEAPPDGHTSFAAGLLFVVFTTTLLDFDALAANCELYMLLPLVASVLLYLRGFAAPRSGALAAAGLLVGVAMLYKYQAAVQLPLYAVHLGFVHRRRLARLGGAWLALAGGLAVPLAICIGLMRRAGALGDALFWFSFNSAYIRQGLTSRRSRHGRSGAFRTASCPRSSSGILGMRAAAAAWRRRRQDPVALFVVWWCAASALATTAGGRFGHYFHQVTAPLAVLAAPEAVRVWGARRKASLAAVGLPAVVFLLIGLFHARAARAVGLAEPDYPTIARFIRARSLPTDELVVWGNVPVLYFEAQRPLGSRFVFSNYLTGLSPATRTQSDPGADASANVVGESWEMFVSDLSTRLPALFVDTSPGNLGRLRKVSADALSAAAGDRGSQLRARRRGCRGARLRSAEDRGGDAEVSGPGASRSRTSPLLAPAEWGVFAVVAAANLVPLWAFRYFPGQDTADHLYAVAVLRSLADGTAAPAVAAAFAPALGLKTNVLFHALMLGLVRLGLSIDLAHRVVLSGYALALPLAGLFCARAAAPASGPLALLLLPLVWSWFAVQGLYNYVLSLPPGAGLVGDRGPRRWAAAAPRGAGPRSGGDAGLSRPHRDLRGPAAGHRDAGRLPGRRNAFAGRAPGGQRLARRAGAAPRARGLACLPAGRDRIGRAARGLGLPLGDVRFPVGAGGVLRRVRRPLSPGRSAAAGAAAGHARRACLWPPAAGADRPRPAGRSAPRSC